MEEEDHAVAVGEIVAGRKPLAAETEPVVRAAQFARIVGDETRQPDIAGNGDDGQREGVAVPAGDVGRRAADGLHMLEQHQSVGCQPIALLAADEERAAHGALQRQHAAADRRRADACDRGRAGKSTLGGDMEEKLQVAPVDFRHIRFLVASPFIAQKPPPVSLTGETGVSFPHLRRPQDARYFHDGHHRQGVLS